MLDAVTLKRVSVSYGSNHKAIDNLTFNIPKSAITCIIGPNGSGKSTLIKAILGLTDYSGKIEVFGKPVKDYYHHIGYLPQRFSFDRTIPITVYELLLLTLNNCDCVNSESNDKQKIEAALNSVGVAQIINEPLSNLSGGQLQRVLLAKAIVHNPKLIILDEPESGVDKEGEHLIYGLLKKMVKEQKISVIMVSHDLDYANQYSDYVVAINSKLVAVGQTTKTLTKKIIDQLYSHE